MKLGQPKLTWNAPPQTGTRVTLVRGRRWHDRLIHQCALWLLARVDYEHAGWRELSTGQGPLSSYGAAHNSQYDVTYNPPLEKRQ